ncbi:MAG: outer membrane beta-barrel protein [Alphaproteobacteria bacterium]|nr:outer membrane beta-barrel protein [Alphaproteobacteria bacterium]
MFWSTFKISRQAGIRRSRILQRRLSERSLAGSPPLSSGIACGSVPVVASSDLVGAMVIRLKSWLARLCLMMVGLLPLGTAAQITGPLPPNVAPPGSPQAAALAPLLTPFNLIEPRFGDFFLIPRVELDETYNSNIFATTTSPTYDLITALAPSFDLVSNFPRNALNLHGTSLLQVYADHPAQNTQDGAVSVDGRLDVTGHSSFYGSAQVAHQHISYGSPNSPGNIAQPVTYWDYVARAGYTQAGRRFSYNVDAGVAAIQYNAALLVGGGVSPQSSGDAAAYDAAVRVNYEIIPDYLGFIRLGGSLYNYWHAVFNNSAVGRIDLGLQILPRHLISGQVYVGYLLQNFAASSPGSTNVPDYGGRLVWSVTPLTTLTLNGLRTFLTGNFSNPSLAIPGPAGNGYLATTITANAEHELMRDLLVNLNAGYENDSFQGITRTDNAFNAGAGVTYFVTRNLYLGGTLNYYQRISTASGSSYSQNVLMLRIGTQF